MCGSRCSLSMRRLSLDEANRSASSSDSTAFSTYSSCLVMGTHVRPVQRLNRKNEKGVNGFRDLPGPIAPPPACAVPRRARPCRPRTKRRGSIQARAAPYSPRPCEPFVVSARELSVSNGRSREALPRKRSRSRHEQRRLAFAQQSRWRPPGTCAPAPHGGALFAGKAAGRNDERRGPSSHRGLCSWRQATHG